MRRLLITAGAIAAFGAASIALAQTQEGVTQAQSAALADLSAVYGAPVVRLDQAKAICNEEQYLADCAEIGKKRDLFSGDRAKQVDTLLTEIRGAAVEKLKQCGDVACLVDVATSIASRLNSQNPAIAKAMELTPAKVKEKREIVETAKSLGVDMEACRTMDPETASVELLRSCAKLAKHENVQKYIGKEARERVKEADAMIGLKESLEKKEVACGDGTLEGCGAFCLAPSPEAKAKGSGAVPPVCRAIASRFFGEKGIEELERAYSTVQETFDAFAERAKNAVFTTPDGRTLTDPAAIGRYMEEAGSRGDVDIVTRGMDFLQAKGFVTGEDRDFALTMVRKINERGPVNFDACREDPSRCADVVPEEQRGQFAAMGEVDKIMRGEMQTRGVDDPRRCVSDASAGAACLEAARAALPQLERLAGTSEEAKRMVSDIRQRVRFGEAGLDARARVEERFKTEGDFAIGERRFSSVNEVDSFCRENSQQCLAETVREGIFSKDVAAEKYERVININYNYNYNLPPPMSPPEGRQFEQAGQIGQISQAGQVSQLRQPAFNKEEALQKFKAWLDNPTGAPPMPPGMEPIGGYPQYQSPGQPGQYGQYPAPYPMPKSDPRSCQYAASAPSPCKAGEYRQESVNELGCATFGSCIPLATKTEPPRLDGKQICPALPTVDSCPAGGEKFISFTSPECGTYYGCRATKMDTANQNQTGTSCEQKYGSSWKAVDGSGNCFGSGLTEYYDPGGILRQCSANPVYGCTSTSPIVTSPPGGQREQTWNSYGLRSWVRSDANASRIEALKASCANVTSSQANVWMPAAGTSSSEDFGMPDPAKCTQAGACASGQYFDGSACTTSNYQNYQTSCPSGQYWNGSSCVSSSGTSSMYRCTYPHAYFSTDSREFTAFCERDYVNCKRVDTNAPIETAGLSLGAPSSCESGWTNGSTSCPSGQYWSGSACVTSTTQTTTSCTSGQYWDGSRCVTSTTQTTTTGSCSSENIGLLGSGCHSMGNGWFNTEMTQYVLSGGNTVKNCAAEYVSGCSGGTAQTQSQTSCSSGQYWNGTACVTSTTQTSPGTSCPSGQWWNGTACTSATSGTDYASAQQGCTSAGGTWDSSSNYCRMPNTTTSCGSGQYWNGSACVTSTTQTQTSTSCGSGQYWNGSTCVATSPTDTVPTDTSSWQQSCASAGGTWESSSNYCRMPTQTTTYTPPPTETTPTYTPPPTETYTPPPTESPPPPPPTTTTESAPISYLFCPDGHDWNGAYCALSPRSPFERYTANAWSAFRSLIGF